MSRRLEIELKRSKYRLLGLVGQGQFGRVFCAVHRSTGQLVALKELEQQRFPTHKFLRELRFLLSLQHPNIVTCQALEHTSTGRCLVMDYCEGGTLRSLMSEDNHLSLFQGIRLVADILAGLEHAHHHDIVHCDIKPENILLHVDPKGWIARISDFGVARLSRELSNQELGNTGSPAYMAPERFYGQYSPTSDLYAVGILLFELIVGRRPFSGTPAELMSAHLNQPVKIPETVPEVWHPLLITALQKLSARRFQTASDMLTMLQSIATNTVCSMDQDTLPLSSSFPEPLFRATKTPLVTPFPSQHQAELQQPVVALAAQSLPFCSDPPCHSSVIYQAIADRVVCFEQCLGAQPWEEQSGETSEPFKPVKEDFHPVRKVQCELSYSSPVQALLLRPQGCFVVTQRSLHLISPEDKPGKSLISHPLLELKQNEQGIDHWAAINHQGHWIATLVLCPDPDAETKTGKLSIWSLPRTHSPNLVSHLVSVSLELKTTEPVQLIALDTHHVALVLDQESPPMEAVTNSPQPFSMGSQIQVFTRRGTQVSALSLPVRPGKLIQMSSPHQLLGIDRDNPRSLLLIDLKPYRILRLGIEIAPSFLLSTAWGCVVASEQGEIVCLDRDLRPIGQLMAPTTLTAIAAVDPHGLLIATWDSNLGCLHTLDLRESGLDLLF